MQVAGPMVLFEYLLIASSAGCDARCTWHVLQPKGDCPPQATCPVLGTDSCAATCSSGINKPSSVARLIGGATLLDGVAAQAPTILRRTIATRRELGSWPSRWATAPIDSCTRHLGPGWPQSGGTTPRAPAAVFLRATKKMPWKARELPGQSSGTHGKSRRDATLPRVMG